jgi:lipopolysaccharide biosynthesis protein
MNRVKAIAFYLPQYHPIPENDAWWGRGFTEWTNVSKALPLFPGHYQPHIPSDLGFYDLRLPEARQAQADLARDYGISGFCYYHYWFNGKRILERPFNEVLKSEQPDFPFCLCWANENWTRTWDGGDKHILLEQKYCHEDDVAHIKSLLPAFRDKRYMRINGRPLFLVYRTTLLPDPKRTAEVWREVAVNAGIGDLYLVNVESFSSHDVDPRSIGFDASVEFEPDFDNIGKPKFRTNFHRKLALLGILPKAYVEHFVVNYNSVIQGMLNRQPADYTRFHCVTPSWDNSARKKKNAFIISGSNPKKYEEWMRKAVERTIRRYEGDERVVFVNAWNEWAEGNHLEPDLEWGRAYLKATLKALESADAIEMFEASFQPVNNSSVCTSIFKNSYWKLREFIAEQAELLRVITTRKY